MQQPLFHTTSTASASVSIMAYLAGLFDGEGYVGFYDTNTYLSSGRGRGRPRKGEIVTKSEVRHSYVLRIGIGLTGTPGKRLISSLQENFGGHVQLDLRHGRPEHWQSAHQWNVYGKEAASLLYALLPFLHVKRLSALVGISFMEAIPIDAEGFEKWRALLLWSRQI